MNIDSLILFLAVVDCKSFSEAAFEKNVSQSSLSKQIRSLEYYYGVKFFDRSSHNIRLTEAGQVFAEQAEKLVREYYALNNAMAFFDGTMGKSLRIASSPVLHLYDFSSLIKNFLQANPGIHIHINETALFSIVKDLDRLSIDLAIVRSEALPDKKNYRFVPLAMDEIVFLCSTKNPLANEKAVSIDQINKENLVLLKPAVYEYTEILKNSGITIEDKNILLLYSAFTITEYVKDLNYASIMMREMAKNYMNDPHIKVLPIEGLSKTTLDIIVPQNSKSVMAEKFIAFAAEFFQ